jgi:hypothetical protein
MIVPIRDGVPVIDPYTRDHYIAAAARVLELKPGESAMVSHGSCQSWANELVHMAQPAARRWYGGKRMNSSRNGTAFTKAPTRLRQPGGDEAGIARICMIDRRGVPVALEGSQAAPGQGTI